MTEHDIVVGGLRLHYLVRGADRSGRIVFLHGGGLSARTWDHVCGSLESRYQCLALDLRGHGDSEWSPSMDYGLDTHVRDLAGFIEELALDEFVLVGQSLGGHAAIRYASDHSDRLAGLVVVDTTPFTRDGPALERLRRFMLDASEFDSLDDAVAHVLAYQPTRDSDAVRRSLQHSLRVLPDGRLTWKHDQRHLGEDYIAKHLQAIAALLPAATAIRCGTLVVRGSRGVTEADARAFASLLHDASWVTVEDAGHNVQSENPAELVAALLPFLERVLPHPVAR